MDLRKILGIESKDLSPESAQLVAMASGVQASPGLRRYRVRRKSMEQLDLIKVVFCGFERFIASLHACNNRLFNAIWY